jgi:hypothetical protein
MRWPWSKSRPGPKAGKRRYSKPAVKKQLPEMFGRKSEEWTEDLGNLYGWQAREASKEHDHGRWSWTKAQRAARSGS